MQKLPAGLALASSLGIGAVIGSAFDVGAPDATVSNLTWAPGNSITLMQAWGMAIAANTYLPDL